MSKKVLLIIASEGYQPIEFNEPRKLLQESGFEVFTASDKPGQAVSSDGSTTVVNYTLNQVNPDKFDAIFVIGGPGAMDHLDNSDVYRVIQGVDKIDKVFGAICISTRILANAGVLQYRNVTGWDNDNKLADILQKAGAVYVKSGVVVDNNLITATGPDAAKDFAKAIVDALNNPEL
jgi:protease I